MNERFGSNDLREESVMDTSIGSDGEWSSTCISPRSPAISPTESEKSIPIDLKFSIANILRPEFGIRRDSPSPMRSGAGSSLSIPVTPEKIDDEEKAQNHTSSAAVQAAAAAALGLAAQPIVWPAWVYCTRYSDRPSSGPRCRRIKRKANQQPEEKRPRTAFTAEQLNRLKNEFQENRYLTEKRRQELAHELGLNESQIKIWFQNKRAKIKKQVGCRNPLAFHLLAQGLYNHTTVPIPSEFGEENQVDACSEIST